MLNSALDTFGHLGGLGHLDRLGGGLGGWCLDRLDLDDALRCSDLAHGHIPGSPAASKSGAVSSMDSPICRTPLTLVMVVLLYRLPFSKLTVASAAVAVVTSSSSSRWKPATSLR